MRHRDRSPWWNIIVYKKGREFRNYSTTGGKAETKEDVLAELKKEYSDEYTFEVSQDPIERGEVPRAALMKRYQAMRPSVRLPDNAEEDYGDWFLPEPDPYGVARVIPLGEAKNEVIHGEWDDFVYLRPLGVVVFDVRHHNSHEIFMTYWYRLFKFGIEGGKTLAQIDDLEYPNFDKEQDLFTDEKYGFFVSSALGSNHITLSEDFTMTAAEKQVFGHIRQRRI